MINALDPKYFERIAQRVAHERTLEKKVETKPRTPITPKLNPSVKEQEGYVFVPSLGLYISSERNNYGPSWEKTQEELYNHFTRMPTIPEFIEFLKYLRSDEGKSKVRDADEILDEILNKSGGEYLDAEFEEVNNEIYLNYRTSNKVVDHPFIDCEIHKVREKLETNLQTPHLNLKPYLQSPAKLDLEFWLNNHTLQGLPISGSPKGELRYWNPKGGCVAKFLTNQVYSLLDCTHQKDCIDYSMKARLVVNPNTKDSSYHSDPENPINMF